MQKYPLLISVLSTIAKYKGAIKASAIFASEIEAKIIGKLGLVEESILKISWKSKDALAFIDEAEKASMHLSKEIATLDCPFTKLLLKKIAQSPNKTYWHFRVIFSGKALGKMIPLYSKEFSNRDAGSFRKEADDALRIIR